MHSDLDVSDYELLKSRLCSRMCDTCVFRPGNPVMGPERLREFETDALDAGSFVVCHKTYRPLGLDGARAAICRGFYNRHRHGSLALVIIDAMWGFVEVEP